MTSKRHIFYVWDSMEARQLARVVARHIGNEEIMAQAAFLLRVFPPEGELANPEDWKSQPLTIVKPIVRDLFALPVPFEYTLMDARNWLDPFINEDGKHVKIQQVWGFSTDMNDQIPLERAYEIWQDKPMLRKWHATKPWEEWPRYTKEEIRDGIKAALKTHLKAMRDVVSVMTKKYGKQLLLQKEPFSLLKPPAKIQLPADSVYVLTMERLSSATAELENRETLALPVEEREAQFISIRGVVPASKSNVVTALEKEVKADPRYAQRVGAGEDIVMVFEFSPNSRDSRLREGRSQWYFAMKTASIRWKRSGTRLRGTITILKRRQRVCPEMEILGSINRSRPYSVSTSPGLNRWRLPRWLPW